MKNQIIFGDNLEVLGSLNDASIDLIYIDPPFNTGKQQARQQIRVEQDKNGDRVGFGGNRYQTTVLGERAYRDHFHDDYLGFLEPRMQGEAYRTCSRRMAACIFILIIVKCIIAKFY